MTEKPATSRLAPGAQLGPYKIEAALGAGGMGEVFRARDTRLDRTVAIKLIRSEFAQRGDFRHRFEREARTISALNHPHICSLYDVGEQDGFAYLVMEYVEGETLAELLRRAAPAAASDSLEPRAPGVGPRRPQEGGAPRALEIAVALRYGAQIADALAAAHARGIVHRDLKPANIMITQAGVKTPATQKPL